jgi:hypothetical protein
MAWPKGVSPKLMQARWLLYRAHWFVDERQKEPEPIIATTYAAFAQEVIDVLRALGIEGPGTPHLDPATCRAQGHGRVACERCGAEWVGLERVREREA